MSAARSRRGRVKKYEEAESDIDMSDTERAFKQEPDQNKNENVSKNREIEMDLDLSEDSDWESRQNKQQKKESNMRKAKQEAQARAQAKLSLLPKQSLDLIVLLLTRLDLGTLINIARINKEFQNLLVRTETGSSILRAVRTQKGLPIFKGMSEIHFASLCYGTICFFECGQDASNLRRYHGDFSTELILKTSVRLCKGCEEEDLLYDENAFLNIHSGAHRRALERSPHAILIGRDTIFKMNTTVIIDGKRLDINSTLDSITGQLDNVELEVQDNYLQAARGSTLE